ncbi:GTP-binding membrane protein [Candidatus Kuenenia stuttgartiensis]|uniref:Elongation factor 4 n=1 Tax=Kuenenia stuttgartiensis TaxID=174633 RepID=A0A2C9CAJ3_KUEST|nr:MULTISPECIES: translation elongation factor 4 [Kuenenia]MBE7546984.1 elongation factor 4 [Planctomycetia bacterium]MBZ0191894.1 translation elongation factor 4 [Candidatus Kuenenia stuttgartiensis]MCF6151384.1 elongation factor 4 [Candidatus Kuenenia stuttgartiensis]MCL4726277.1 translation elongation factor 4 [Candidatus Kuenenia stuttgartiensis]MCZ7623085.1 translation elongation factor 4 [Candidatus Kuenenia sp.]
MSTERIRNFCIIAHIDHGKSTLADRLLERTQAISTREFRNQMLDDMDLERERGITIKASAVALTLRRGETEYNLNLIDTPGHVDFSYEVSRSLGSCEGALLLVDASQGVEAQTVANTYLAMEHDLVIIPVVSKIDLPQSRPYEVLAEMEKTLGISSEEALMVSAKSGEGVDQIFDAIIKYIPPPKGDPSGPLRALIFDSEYDAYRGVIIYLRVFDGSLKVGDEIFMIKTRRSFKVEEVGVFKPKMAPKNGLFTGEVGYCIANIKSIHDVKVGDTVTLNKEKAEKPLTGYRQPIPMVYCGIYPVDNADFKVLREALERLSLNDSSFSFIPETSQALGFGFRCGFLGLLHMDIVQERLERESHINIVQTAPNVTYEILKTNKEVIRVDNPESVPPVNEIDEFREPMVRSSFVLPTEYLGAIMQLAEARRGRYKSTEYLSEKRAILVYELPLAEIIFDFFDKMKSATRGYGTLDYDLIGYESADLVKLDILVGGKRVDALSTIVHKKDAEVRGRKQVKKLKKEISRHLFEVVLQAAIGSRVIARETIKPIAKNVTAKCYGGDITRKRKLLEKQKEGKKRMKSVGNVEIPQKAFLSVLSIDDDE